MRSNATLIELCINNIHLIKSKGLCYLIHELHRNDLVSSSEANRLDNLINLHIRAGNRLNRIFADKACIRNEKEYRATSYFWRMGDQVPRLAFLNYIYNL